MNELRDAKRNPRAKGTNPRATGTSPRCLGTNPNAGTAKDAARVASTVRQAATVAAWRGDDQPTASRSATMYLQCNRLAGGPRPVRHASPYGAWWTIPEWQTERAQLWARFNLAPVPAGPLGTLTAGELAAMATEVDTDEPAADDAEAEPP